MRPPAPAGGATHTSYFLIILHSPLATGLSSAASSKLSLPLAYRGVQAVRDQGGALIGDIPVVAFVLPPRVTAVLFVLLPRGILKQA